MSRSPIVQYAKALDYLLGPGQARADDLGYVPLSSGIIAQSRRAVDRIGK